MSDDEKAIRDLVKTWMEASQAGDLETVLSLMTDDVVFMVPGREPFGKEAFAADLKQMGGVQIRGSSEVVELRILNDWAFIRNTSTLPQPPRAGRRPAGPGIRSRFFARNLMGGGF